MDVRNSTGVGRIVASPRDRAAPGEKRALTGRPGSDPVQANRRSQQERWVSPRAEPSPLLPPPRSRPVEEGPMGGSVAVGRRSLRNARKSRPSRQRRRRRPRQPSASRPTPVPAYPGSVPEPSRGSLLRAVPHPCRRRPTFPEEDPDTDT